MLRPARAFRPAPPHATQFVNLTEVMRAQTAFDGLLGRLGRACGLIILVAGRVTAVDESLELQLAADGKYSLKLGDTLWLRSAPTVVRAGGRNFSTADGTLIPAGNHTTAGEDAIGRFSSTTLSYNAGQT